MGKKIATLVSLLFLTGMVFAQDEEKTDPADTVKNWKTGGRIALTFNQVALSNWAAGGENSFSGNTEFRLSANYVKGKNTWDNSLMMAYGLIKQESRNLNKNDDRIELISKYGRHAVKNWYFSEELTFRSQFDEGYKTPEDTVKISDFMAPGYLTFSFP